MKKEASHTKPASLSNLRLLPEIGLVDLADPSLPVRLAGKLSEQLELFASQMRHGLLAASVAIGLDVMGELVDAEVSDIAGAKGRHDTRTAPPTATAPRTGKVTLGGRRIPVRRPRVRTVADEAGVDQEVHLESYDTLASVDLLADHMVASMLAGLSGRRYQHGAGTRRRDQSRPPRRGPRSRRCRAGSSLPPPSGSPSSGRGRWTTSAG